MFCRCQDQEVDEIKEESEDEEPEEVMEVEDIGAALRGTVCYVIAKYYVIH